MKYLLSRKYTPVLRSIAAQRVLLAFDYDGTLAPIVAERDQARMRARTADLLARVCRLYPCAVISGRSRQDTLQLVASAGVLHVIGNHGLEPGPCLAQFERQVMDARRILEPLVAGVPGVEIEDKRYSLAIHYRKANHKHQARTAIRAALGALPVRMRAVPGKRVINLVSAQAPNKGHALLTLLQAEGTDKALYVGDDYTDEDVFETEQPKRLFTVRIGRSRSTAAAYFLRHQGEMDRLLSELIALRS